MGRLYTIEAWIFYEKERVSIWGHMDILGKHYHFPRIKEVKWASCQFCNVANLPKSVALSPSFTGDDAVHKALLCRIVKNMILSHS